MQGAWLGFPERRCTCYIWGLTEYEGRGAWRGEELSHKVGSLQGDDDCAWISNEPTVAGQSREQGEHSGRGHVQGTGRAPSAFRREEPFHSRGCLLLDGRARLRSPTAGERQRGPGGCGELPLTPHPALPRLQATLCSDGSATWQHLERKGWSLWPVCPAGGDASRLPLPADTPQRATLDLRAPGDTRTASRPSDLPYHLSLYSPLSPPPPPPSSPWPCAEHWGRGLRPGDDLASSPSLWLPGSLGDVCHQPATVQREGRLGLGRESLAPPVVRALRTRKAVKVMISWHPPRRSVSQRSKPGRSPLPRITTRAATAIVPCATQFNSAAVFQSLPCARHGGPGHLGNAGPPWGLAGTNQT